MSDSIESVIRSSIADATVDDSAPVESSAEPVESVEPVEATAEPVEGAEPTEEPAEIAEHAVEASAESTEEPPAQSTGELDEFAKEHGIKSKDKLGRENRIPFSRVKKINENAVKKARTAWEAEMAPVHATNKEYEQRLQKIGETEDMLFNRPEQFLGVLRTIPGYAELLGSANSGRSTQSANQSATADSDLGPMPQPDVDDNGRKGYSPEGLAKLLEWNAEKATRAAIKKTEERLGARIKPFEEVAAQHRATVEQDRQITGALDAAYQWEGFKENEAEILKVLQEDKEMRIGLGQAYRIVMNRNITTARTERKKLEADIRKEILAELKSAPRGTSASGAGSVGRGAETGGSIEDVIRASIRASKS